MCGNDKHRIKNIYVTGIIDVNNSTITKVIELPFDPKTVELTLISYTAIDLPAQHASILSMTSSLIQPDERFVSISILNPQAVAADFNDSKTVHEIFDIQRPIHGLYSFTFALDIGGNPIAFPVAPFGINVAFHLRFVS